MQAVRRLEVPGGVHGLIHMTWGGAAAALAAVAVSLILAAAGLPSLAVEMRTVCTAPPCGWAQLGPEAAAGLGRLGLTLDAWAVYWVALNGVYVPAFCGVAALLALLRPREPMALLGCVMLAVFGATFSDPAAALSRSDASWVWPFRLWSFVGTAAVMPFFYLFPDGRFAPRWTRWAAVAWVVASGINFLSPPWWEVNTASWFVPLAFGFVLSLAAAQVYRYAWVASPLQRQQIKVVVAGFLAALGSFFGLLVLVVPRTSGSEPGSVLAHLVVESAFPVTQLLIPVSILIAILHYRLWDIDVVLNRALVYAALTACVITAYVVSVGYLSGVFHTTDNLAVSLIATGLVAVVFQPIRERLQRTVNRLMYGERDEPYIVLSRLGQRLEAVLVPQAVPATVVSTVRDALRLPYAALAIQAGDGLAIAAEVGQQVADLLHLPLSYRGEVLGELRLGPRSSGEAWSRADRRLLDDLARQVGVAAHGLRTLADLQRSRERLVLAREEERRRLRSDLHDDLAPALAALALHADAAGELLERDPAAAARLVSGLQTALRHSVAEVRRLAYDLRPPALDDLGLVEAIRDRTAQFSRSGAGLQVRVEVIGDLPPLPAATEVAAYRIIQEALMNVHRHAEASCCHIRLAIIDGLLELEVKDDGMGLSETYPPGIGLRSMRERAAELGGWCRFERVTPHGTRVVARLPVAVA